MSQRTIELDDIAEIETPGTPVRSSGGLPPPRGTVERRSSGVVSRTRQPVIELDDIAEIEEITPLDDKEEQKFLEWVAKEKKIRDLDQPATKYDYRGYWKEVASKGRDTRQIGKDGKLHWPDTYKQHGHETFSRESKYSTGPNDGGHWEGETFVRPRTESDQFARSVREDIERQAKERSDPKVLKELAEKRAKPPTTATPASKAGEYAVAVDPKTGEERMAGKREQGEARISPGESQALGLRDWLGELVTKDDSGQTVVTTKGLGLVPFIGSVAVAADAWNVIRAAQRVRDGKGTDADERIVSEFVERDAEAQRRGTSFLYKVVDTLANVPAFAAEFSATGGAFTGLKALVQGAVAKIGAKAAGKYATKALVGKGTQVLAKGAGAIAGGAAQTAAQPQRIVAGTLERMAPDAKDVSSKETMRESLQDWDDDFLPALMKAAPDHFIEVTSERSGALLEPILGKLAKLPIADRVAALKKYVMERWIAKHAGAGAKEFFERVGSASGWNGVLGESFEESVGGVARDVLPRPFYDEQPLSAETRMLTGAQLDPEHPVENPRLAALADFVQQKGVEVVAFSAMPGLRIALETGAGLLDKRESRYREERAKALAEFRSAVEAAAADPAKREALFKQFTAAGVPAEVAEALLSQVPPPPEAPPGPEGAAPAAGPPAPGPPGAPPAPGGEAVGQPPVPPPAPPAAPVDPTIAISNLVDRWLAASQQGDANEAALVLQEAQQFGLSNADMDALGAMRARGEDLPPPPAPPAPPAAVPPSTPPGVPPSAGPTGEAVPPGVPPTVGPTGEAVPPATVPPETGPAVPPGTTPGAPPTPPPTTLPPAAEQPTTPAPAAPAPPVEAAIGDDVGNGWVRGPGDYDVQVGSTGPQGQYVLYTKRHRGLGSQSSFYIDKTGTLIDAANVNFSDQGAVDNLWQPTDEAERDHVLGLMRQIALLPLTDKKRAELQFQLKDFVRKAVAAGTTTLNVTEGETPAPAAGEPPAAPPAGEAPAGGGAPLTPQEELRARIRARAAAKKAAAEGGAPPATETEAPPAGDESVTPPVTPEGEETPAVSTETAAPADESVTPPRGQMPLSQDLLTALPATVEPKPERVGKPEEAKEREVIEGIKGRTDELIAEYEAKNGTNYNGDKMSELLGVHEGDDLWANIFAVRSSAGELVTLAFRRALRRPITAKNIFVEMLGGGSGAGKTTMAARFEGPKADKKGVIVLDTTLAHLPSTLQNIGEALATGHGVKITFVYRDPIVAFLDGVAPRAVKEGRPVQLTTHASTHYWAPRNLLKIARLFGTDGPVQIDVIENATDEAIPRSLDWLEEKIEADYHDADEPGSGPLRAALEDALRDAVDRGDISSALARRLGADEDIARPYGEESDRGLGGSRQAVEEEEVATDDTEEVEDVDEAPRGEKLKGYHGSAEIGRRGTFDGFRLDIDPTGATRETGRTIDSMGTWWSSSRKDAEYYGRSYAEDGTTPTQGAVVEGEIELKNARVFESAEEFVKFVDAFRQKTDGGGRAPASGKAVREAIEKDGHDGIIVRGGGKGDATPEGGDFYLSFDNAGVTTGAVTMPAPAAGKKKDEEVAEGPPTVVFRSGNTRAPADLEGFIDAGQPVGITADANQGIIDRVVAYVKAGGYAFIDSGAFGTVDPDFLTILNRYGDIAKALGYDRAAGARMSVVMPDKVGDAAATMRLQAQWRNWSPSTLRSIWPVQVSDSVVEDAVATFEAAPLDALGFPGNKSAISLEDLKRVLDAIRAKRPGWGGPRAGFHLLGIGEKNAKFQTYVDAIREVFPNAIVTTDSVRTTALMGVGRPAHTEAKDLADSRAEEDVDTEWASDTTEIAGAFYDGRWRGNFTNKELRQFASALGLPVQALQRARRIGTLRNLIGNTGLEQALDLAFFDVATKRGLRRQRPGARTAMIEKHDRKPVDERPAKQMSTPEREAIIEEILAAAEKHLPEPKAVEQTEWKGTDGKWYRGLTLPGVQPVSPFESRSIGWVLQRPEGTTHGELEKTKEAVLERVKATRAQNKIDFRDALERKTDEQLQGAAAYWLRRPNALGLYQAFTVENLQVVFDLTREQAEATMALAEAMDLDLSRIYLIKGGTPGIGAMPQFAGEQASIGTQMRTALATARTMAADMKDPEEIRAVTGWYPNPYDGKLRWEIPDDRAKLTPAFENLAETGLLDEGITIPLSEAIDHPELFAAYPQLADLKVERRRAILDIHEGVYGWHTPSKNLITVTPYSKDTLGTLLHEIQHAIQSIEGFARGSNAEEALQAAPRYMLEDVANDLEDDLEDRRIPEYESRLADEELVLFSVTRLIGSIGRERLQEHLRAAWEKEPDDPDARRLLLEAQLPSLTRDALYNLAYARTVELLLGKLENEIRHSRIELDEAKEDLVTLQVDRGHDEDLRKLLDRHGAGTKQFYESVAGEIEARDTTARRALTAEQRRAVEPYTSENISPYEAILIKEDRATAPSAPALKQGAKAAVEFTDAGDAIMRGLSSPDVSSGAHELAHIFRKFVLNRRLDWKDRLGISEEDIDTVERAVGAEDGIWHDKADELFARMVERYLRTGLAPTKALRSLFEKFAEWLSRIYKTLTGSKIDVGISSEMRIVLDKMVTRRAARERAEAARTAPKIDEILSQGAAADAFEKGARVVYGHSIYTAEGREGDELRLALEADPTKGLLVDARNVQRYEEALLTRVAKDEAASRAMKAEETRLRNAGADKKNKAKARTWMNEGEIEEAVSRFADDPVLGPAARFLEAYKDEINRVSDGWPYWTQGTHPASQLMALLHGHLRAEMGVYPALAAATDEDVRATLGPIKAFMTKRGDAAGIKLPTLPGGVAPKAKAAPKAAKPAAKPAPAPTAKPAAPPKVETEAQRKERELIEKIKARQAALGKKPLYQAAEGTPEDIDDDSLDLVIQLVQMYVEGGLTDFRDVAHRFQGSYGAGARAVDLYLESAWEELQGEAVSVEQALAAGPTMPEEETTDAGPDDLDGGGQTGTGDAGEPAGGAGDGGPGELEGEQPVDQGAPPKPGKSGGRGKRGAVGGVQPGGVRTAPEGDGDAVRSGEGTHDPSHVDPADEADDPDVRDAHARGQRPRNFVIDDTQALTAGGPADKLADNLAAIRLLKVLDAEERPATDAEQAVLARYIGWGHTYLKPIVNPLGVEADRDARQIEARRELELLLTSAELRELGESILNSHYSFNDLPRALWRLVQHLGFKGGSILEPAVGTGHFFGTMPGEILKNKKTMLFGVDKEPIAARIAKQLYQSAHIQNSPLEKANIAEGYLDLIISNVPFGNYEVYDEAFVSSAKVPMTRSIHNYYFGKALDAVRPGGIIVFVTSSYTMNSKTDSVRQYIAERSRLLGAFRMPNTTFLATAGTGVVADVIVLQKYHEGEKHDGESWMGTEERLDLSSYNRDTKETEHARTNEYFIRHPERVLGTETMRGKSEKKRVGQYTVEGALTPAQLQEVVDAFPANVYKPSKKPARKFALGQKSDVKQGRFVLQDGKLYNYDKGTLVPSPLKAKALARATAFIPLRDAYQQVLDALMSNASDAVLEGAQAGLRKAYDFYVAQWGLVNHSANRSIIQVDPDGPRILALEDVVMVREPGAKIRTIKKIGEADIFKVRVSAPPKEPTSAATPQDALVQSLAWKGGVDIDYMHALSGMPIDEMTQALAGDIFQDAATGAWLTRDDYLSGDVVTKLAQAEAKALTDASFKANVVALMGVQPKFKTIDEFKAPFGATWIPPDIYKAFFREESRAELDITLVNHEGRTAWYVENPSGQGTHEFLPSGESFAEWVGDALNNRLPDRYSGEGKDRHKDQALTDAYRESLKQLRESWAQWYPTNPEVAETLPPIFNALLNREAARVYDGTHLVFPNMSPLVKLRRWQKNVIWRAIQAGNTLIAHTVGAGKTYAMIGIAGEWKRLGLANKPIIAVPNPLVRQWTNDFLKMYPTARILVPTEADFEAANRRRFISQIANNDWDAIIIGHSQFERISVKVETLRAFFKKQEDLLLADGAEQMNMTTDDFGDLVTRYENEEKAARRALSPRNAEPTVRDIVRAILKLRVRLQKRLNQSKKDIPIMFEELGIDGVMIDEAHYFKNLFFSTSRNKIAGLRGSDADRAMDMFLKVRMINEQSNSRNVIFATGTPITNAMSEVFTVFRFLGSQLLERMGMSGFDSWSFSYAIASAANEPAPGGGYQERTRLRYWSNLKELSAIFRRFADVFTRQDLIAEKVFNDETGEWEPAIKLPKVKGGRPTIISTPAHPQYPEFNDQIQHRVADIKSGRPQQRMGKKGMVDDNSLWINSDAGKAAIDLRLVMPHVPPDPNGRIPEAARQISKRYFESTEVLGTQLVFLDVGVPPAASLPPLPEHVLKGKVSDEAAAAAEEIEDEPAEESDEADQDAALAEMNTGGRDLYTDLKNQLIQQGVKADEIAFIHQARTPMEQQLLYDAVNAGRVRVLIATRAKGGVGVNVQKKAIALHHLDVPWRPDQLEQAEGRIIRQKNENDEVEILRYVTPATFDEFRWGVLATKNSNIIAFYRGELDEMEDVDTTDPSQGDLELAKAISSGNPKELVRINLEREVTTLRSRATNFERRQVTARRAMAAAQAMVTTYETAWEKEVEAANEAKAWEQAPTVTITKRVRRSSFGYTHLVDAETPQTFDWKTKEGRAELQAALVELLKDHEVESATPIATAGPFTIYAEGVSGAMVFEGGETTSTSLSDEQKGTEVYVKIGTQHVGTLSTWRKSHPEPPDYAWGLSLNLTSKRLQTRADQSKNIANRYNEERLGHVAVLEKKFTQGEELRRKERELRALQVELGMVAPDAAEVLVDLLRANTEQYLAGTIDEATWTRERDALLTKAREAGVTTLNRVLKEAASWSSAQAPETADDRGGGGGGRRGGGGGRRGGGTTTGGTPEGEGKPRKGESKKDELVEGLGAELSEDIADAFARAGGGDRTGEPPPGGVTTGTIPAGARAPSEAAVAHPIMFPELVELVKELLGSPPQVKARIARKLGTRGRFIGEGPGRIEIRADLFTEERQHELAAVLAHEIGHATDWLPHRTLKRGKLLGRLFSLRKYMKGKFTGPNGTIKEADIKKELVALSSSWRPWNRDDAEASDRAYRDSSVELYADAVSVLLNDPGRLEREAPIFFREFFAGLDQKPEVRRAYFELMERLAGTTEELVARRLAGMFEMFEKGDATAIDVLRHRQRTIVESSRSIWQSLQQEFVDKNMPFYKLRREARAAGQPVPEDIDPVFALEERSQLGAQMKAYVEQNVQPLLDILKQVNVGWHTFGAVLMLERITSGDRSEMANPRGFSPEVAQQLLDTIRRSLGDEQNAALDEAVARFRKMVRRMSIAAHDAGLYTDETYKDILENEAYAAFRVVDYLEEEVNWRIHHQIGTLKDIANPANTTILKLLSTFRAIKRQQMLVKAFDFLHERHPEAIQQAKEIGWGRSHQVLDPKQKGLKLVRYWEKGKLRGKWVDETYADSLNNASTGFNNGFVRFMRAVNSKWFRKVYTAVNLGFQMANFARDFIRFWKNIPGMTLARAFRLYWRARTLAWVRAHGLPEKPTEAQMRAYLDMVEGEKAGILTMTFNDVSKGRDIAETEIEDILAMHRVGPYGKPKPSSNIVKAGAKAIVNWIEDFGDYIETLPKAAAMYEYKGTGPIAAISPETRSLIRRTVGSPDFTMGGTQKPWFNEVFLFANAIIQGWRADLGVATGKETWLGWWVKTFATNVVPKMLAAAILYGLPDEWLSGDGDDDDGFFTWAGKYLKRSLAGATEYDLTNYNVIPLGYNSKGDSVYFRMPQDDTGRVVGGLIWKAIQAARGDRDAWKTLTQVIDYSAGQVPSLAPIITLGGDIIQYTSGGPVRDPFRQRDLFTRAEQDIGPADLQNFKKFVGYEFQKLGGAIVWKFYVGAGERPEQKTVGQTILDLPVISNIAGRFVKITNYGQVERLRDTSAELRQERATGNRDESQAVKTGIREYMALPEEDQTRSAARHIANRLAKDVYPELRGDKLHKQESDMQKKIRMGSFRGEGDPLTGVVISAATNDERVALIVARRPAMTENDFQDWLRRAVNNQVISPTVKDAVNRTIRRGQQSAVVEPPPVDENEEELEAVGAR